MTTATITATKPTFTGKHGELLTELAKTVEAIFEEHDTSHVKAGDNKVFALGGHGYVVVFDEKVWGGAVEVFTPTASLTVQPDSNGVPQVNPGTLDDQAVKKLLREATEGLRRYYENRYWGTP